jgi:hypothetical protein
MPFLETAGGVLLGGAVSITTSWLADRRKAAREDAKDAQRESAARRGAARLVSDELRRIQAHMGRAQEAVHTWPPSPGFKLPTEAWAQHRETLSQSDEVWGAVEYAYTLVYFLNAETGPEPQTIVWQQSVDDYAGDVIARAEEALDALDRFQAQ